MNYCWNLYLVAALFLLQTGQCRRGFSGGSRSSGRGVSSSRTGTYYAGGRSANRNAYLGGGSYSSSIGSQSRYSSNSFKSAITGAAAGYLTYKAGKYIIRSAISPMMLNHRAYYWDASFYRPRSGMQTCSKTIESTTNDMTTFGNVFFANGTRPTQIVWSCRAHYEQCCEYDCCYPDRALGMFTLSSNDTSNDTQLVFTPYYRHTWSSSSDTNNTTTFGTIAFIIVICVLIVWGYYSCYSSKPAKTTGIVYYEGVPTRDANQLLPPCPTPVPPVYYHPPYSLHSKSTNI